MAGGTFSVDRGIFDHPIFADEKFTEREAWLWMLGAASWRDERKRVNRVIFELKRGQLVGASRHLAQQWKWDESKVRRFLGKLKKDKMIDVLATRDATLITICNYDEYQFGRRTGDAQTDEPATNRRRTGDANKKELKNLNTETEDLLSAGADVSAGKVLKAGEPHLLELPVTGPPVVRPDIEGDFVEWYAAYPRHEAKGAALRAYRTARKKVSKEILLAAVKQPRPEFSDPRYTPLPASWLNAERWADEKKQKPKYDETFPEEIYRNVL